MSSRCSSEFKSIRPLIVLACSMTMALVAFLSCSPSPKTGGGIGGTGSVTSVSSGAVTKLGSISISETEYDNSNTVYCMNDAPCSTVNSLSLGMVVLVQGTTESPSQEPVTRVAHTISYEATVKGVVQSVDPNESGLIVLGQWVQVNQKTVIDESVPEMSLRNLGVGTDVIEVSGLVAGDGHILATLIIKKRSGTPYYEVQGVIKNYDTAARRFQIGQLIVEYASADIGAIMGDSVADWNNQVVHVRGDAWQPANEVPYGGMLRATNVKPLGLTIEDSAEAKLEGFITNVTHSGAVTINNDPIEVSSATAFEGGTANDLVLGTHVFIHGALARGVLSAQRVIFKENLQMESNVGSIDLQSRTLTLAGLPGLSIEVDAGTQVESAGTVSRFEDIRVGDHVKIHAKLVDGNRAAATELERADPTPTVVLEAPLQSAINSQIQLAGVTIETSGVPENEFVGNYGPIGRKTFFEKVLTGRPAWAKGTLSGSTVTWSSVGIRG
jgi:hypothetical protein